MSVPGYNCLLITSLHVDVLGGALDALMKPSCSRAKQSTDRKPLTFCGEEAEVATLSCCFEN